LLFGYAQHSRAVAVVSAKCTLDELLDHAQAVSVSATLRAKCTLSRADLAAICFCQLHEFI
jgi:hypothetical protein